MEIMQRTFHKLNLTRVLSIILVSLGCLQIAGYVLNSRILRGIGFSYGISPLPIVFGTVNGVEGFDTKHTLYYVDKNDNEVILPLNQKLYAEFNRSYFLKNAYAIFLAYPHVLKPEQVEQGMEFLLCNRNIFFQFDIVDSVKRPMIRSERILYGKPEELTLIPHCE